NNHNHSLVSNKYKNNITINNKLIKVVFDSNLFYSMMGIDYVKKFNINLKEESSGRTKIHKDIKIKNIIFSEEFFITDLEDIRLGSDFLEKTKAKVDYNTKKIKLYYNHEYMSIYYNIYYDVSKYS